MGGMNATVRSLVGLGACLSFVIGFIIVAFSGAAPWSNLNLFWLLLNLNNFDSSRETIIYWFLGFSLFCGFVIEGFSIWFVHASSTGMEILLMGIFGLLWFLLFAWFTISFITLWAEQWSVDKGLKRTSSGTLNMAENSDYKHKDKTLMIAANIMFAIGSFLIAIYIHGIDMGSVPIQDTQRRSLSQSALGARPSKAAAALKAKAVADQGKTLAAGLPAVAGRKGQGGGRRAKKTN